MTDLLPCPFCGSPVELVQSAREWVRCTQPDPEKCSLMFNCYPLRMLPPAEHVKMQIKTWNTRHHDLERDKAIARAAWEAGMKEARGYIESQGVQVTVIKSADDYLQSEEFKELLRGE